ncbi:selenium-binding family protein [Actinoplanes sp. TBRC 11911]|nr:selenium-binding family protein [Actinoplanes sp. TBRC 11911]
MTTFYASPLDAANAPAEQLAYVHQTRLQGGDASSDSYCFPSA